MEVVEILGGWVNIYKWIEVNGLSKMIRYKRMNCRKGKEVFLSKNRKFLIILGF